MGIKIDLRVIIYTMKDFNGKSQKDMHNIMEVPITINADKRVSTLASRSISLAMDKKEQGFEVMELI